MELENKFLLSIKEASIFTGLSKSTIKRLMEIDDFVEGIKITARRLVFKKSDIENWINSRPKLMSQISDNKKKVRCPSSSLELDIAYKIELDQLKQRRGL